MAQFAKVQSKNTLLPYQHESQAAAVTKKKELQIPKNPKYDKLKNDDVL